MNRFDFRHTHPRLKLHIDLRRLFDDICQQSFSRPGDCDTMQGGKLLAKTFQPKHTSDAQWRIWADIDDKEDYCARLIGFDHDSGLSLEWLETPRIYRYFDARIIDPYKAHTYMGGFYVMQHGRSVAGPLHRHECEEVVRSILARQVEVEHHTRNPATGYCEEGFYVMRGDNVVVGPCEEDEAEEVRDAILAGME